MSASLEIVALPNAASYATFKSQDVSTCTAFRLFTVLGFSYYYALDAIFQPVDYWRLLFPTFNAEFEISWVYNCGSTTTLVLLVTCGFVPWYMGRIVGGYATMLVVLVALPWSHFVLVGETQNLVMVLASTAILSMAISTVDNTTFALASLFPQGAVEHVQLGMGFALVLSALARIFSKAVLSADFVVAATILYFAIATGVVSTGLLAFTKLMRLPTSRHALHRSQHINLSVWRKIWFQECIVGVSYACSNVVYPGVVSTIPSYNFSSLNSTGWWPLLMMLLFSISNAVGRYCVRWRMGYTFETVWQPVVARWILVPLLLCSAFGWCFTHDVFSTVFVLLLGWSDGYCGTLAVVVVNDCVNSEELSVTGMCTSLSINIGVLAGSSVALAMAKLLHI
ncbi:unnamed protein product [Aphanomyces euteiches]|uniref:Uncharacterized protein n=1 Tax=Aphanomyces euteiches TaxID=100861 RepID=A0A6G0X475_9STRA|nr:hypothetical protein Ae201684_008680 [Aphanomyces euteiches]KAF0734724.1 hypothetical protein Ae201684_008682 [Aphanomyces euteiches]KAH9085337.1 hypothetical protein Ae201684P_005046 [Aphanomyces euteiches]KAH9085403.1 hypothetical protein Ae201684P_005111 [Aphanomyces euteiches]KAH9085762.1 hypothetical protein Ae201684P_005463 [Aphanomyces euteiches]